MLWFCHISVKRGRHQRKHKQKAVTKTALCLCLILRLRLSLCLCSGVLTCFWIPYAYSGSLILLEQFPTKARDPKPQAIIWSAAITSCLTFSLHFWQCIVETSSDFSLKSSQTSEIVGNYRSFCIVFVNSHDLYDLWTTCWESLEIHGKSLLVFKIILKTWTLKVKFWFWYMNLWLLLSCYPQWYYRLSLR